MKAVIVIPTIREECAKKFLEAWKDAFAGHDVIMVEDNPERSFDLPDWVEHVAWKEIDEDLGGDSWIIPRRTGAIRNYGFLLAGRKKPGMIVTLDDDCLPCDSTEDFLSQHWRLLEVPGVDVPVIDTLFAATGTYLDDDIFARGFPKKRYSWKTMVNHGLWNNVPDLDGETQLKHPDLRVTFSEHSLQVPPGILFPMSSMNVAFRPEALPLMYLLPMGEGQPYDRFDDIWCGWIMKKVCDHLGWSVRSGSPFVYHSRASDAKKNAELEAPGLLMNERLWRLIAGIKLSNAHPGDCFMEVC